MIILTKWIYDGEIISGNLEPGPLSETVDLGRGALPFFSRHCRSVRLACVLEGTRFSLIQDYKMCIWGGLVYIYKASSIWIRDQSGSWAFGHGPWEAATFEWRKGERASLSERREEPDPHISLDLSSVRDDFQISKQDCVVQF